jgi:hypothetical protein
MVIECSLVPPDNKSLWWCVTSGIGSVWRRVRGTIAGGVLFGSVCCSNCCCWNSCDLDLVRPYWSDDCAVVVLIVVMICVGVCGEICCCCCCSGLVELEMRV